MRFHILTKHRMTAVQQGGFGDLIVEDIIDAVQEQYTSIVNDQNVAKQILRTNPNLKHCYTVEVIEDLPLPAHGRRL